MTVSGQQNPSSAARRREATRARLLEAAQELLSQRSVADVAVDDLLRAAHISRATFYSFYGSKAELVRAIGDELNQLVETAVLAVNALPRWSRPELRAYVEERTRREWSVGRRAALAVGQANVADPSSYRERIEHLVALLIDSDERWAAMGERTARRRARLFVMNHEKAFLHWVAWGWGADSDRAAALVTEILWTALRVCDEHDV